MDPTIPPAELFFHARLLRRRLARALPGSNATDQIGIAAILLGMLVGDAAYPVDPSLSLQVTALLSLDAARIRQQRHAATELERRSSMTVARTA